MFIDLGLQLYAVSVKGQICCALVFTIHFLFFQTWSQSVQSLFFSVIKGNKNGEQKSIFDVKLLGVLYERSALMMKFSISY